MLPHLLSNVNHPNGYTFLSWLVFKDFKILIKEAIKIKPVDFKSSNRLHQIWFQINMRLSTYIYIQYIQSLHIVRNQTKLSNKQALKLKIKPADLKSSN